MLPNAFQKTTLTNGPRVVTVPLKHVRSVTVLIMVGSGSRYETRKNNGLSHFMEHMLFKGTKKRPTPFDIFSVIDGVGGEYNGGTAKDYLELHIKVASVHLNLVLDVLADTILNSKFEEREIEREKKVIGEEINLREDTPLIRIADIFEELLYGDSPLGWDIAGKKEVIGRFKRNDFLSYLKAFFISNNLVIIVAGDFRKKNVLELISNYFGGLPSGGLPKWEKVDEGQKAPNVLVRYKKTDQAHFRLGVRAYPLEHKNRYAMAVLNTILGEMSSSRLNIEVRQKRGLAYYIHSDRAEYKDVGYWVIQAGVDIDRVEEAIKVILTEFQRMKDKKVGKKELGKAKEYLKGRIILSCEDSRAVASFYGEQELLEGKIWTPQEIITFLNKVTVEDIQRVAREVFVPAKLNLAIVGPYKDSNQFKDLLVL